MQRVSADANASALHAGGRTEQDLRRAVPQRDHLVRVGAHRDACAAGESAPSARHTGDACRMPSAQRSAAEPIDDARRGRAPRRAAAARAERMGPVSTQQLWQRAPKARARPKSASFSALVTRSMSRFWGFRSRCNTLPGTRGSGLRCQHCADCGVAVRATAHRWVWQKATPSSICCMKRCSRRGAHGASKSEQSGGLSAAVQPAAARSGPQSRRIRAGTP